jgi:polyisoprenoid-binding protein YceI
MKVFAMIAPALLIGQLALAQVKIADGTYKMDAAHSKVGFEIPHLGISTVEGKFTDFEGTIVVDPKIEKSKVDITIKTASIDTAKKDRDDHLRSPEFFDSKKFENMIFKSKKVSGTPDAMKIEGDLTIRGVTKPVTLDAKFTGSQKDPWGNDRIAFRATTANSKIVRKDFGLTWSKMVELVPVVGDEATIDLKIEAIKEKAPAKK